MTSRTVHVSQEHIAGAVCKDSHRCMIADALQAQIPSAKYIMVDTQSVRFSNVDTGRRFVYLTPIEAQAALLKFDAGEKVKPFSFTLSRGFSRQMRVRAPGFVPSKKKYKRSGTRLMPSRQREYGLRSIVSA